MISVEQFKLRLMRPNHPDWLLVGVDANDDSQLYILSNGGMANINCAPIELYADQIKYYGREMIAQGELYLKKMKNQSVLVMGAVFPAIRLNPILRIHKLTPIVKKCISQVSLFVGNAAIKCQTKMPVKNSD